jgi:magnesium chelatase subunit D
MSAAATLTAPTAWGDAILAADLLALDPHTMGGIILHGSASPVRDAWLARVRQGLEAAAPMLHIPSYVTAESLLGGLDLAATLGTGQRTAQHGTLARADRGLAVLAMAERWSPAMTALVTSVLDRGEIIVERDGCASRTPSCFGIVALDESLADEPGPPPGLTDRLAVWLNLDEAGREAIANPQVPRPVTAQMRQILSKMPTADRAIVTALCRAALELGIVSLRAPALALAVARAHAALDGRSCITTMDAAAAARLVLAPRASRIPERADALADETQTPAELTPGGDKRAADDTTSTATPDDVVLAAACAAVPAGLLQSLAHGEKSPRQPRTEGHSGSTRKSVKRGRITGIAPAGSAASARLNVLATLRAAAPWQRLRRLGRPQIAAAGVQVRRADFRVNRYKHQSGTTIIFAVDASGSAALHRLAEAKGAVELLLAECYARRDSIALIAFRGTTADVRLPPTRSLVRAKRSLAGLPGGGGTPIAAGLEAAAELALGARRNGDTPLIVLLTDGRANVSRGGKAGRPEAEKQATEVARQINHHAIASVLLDTSPQPNPFAKRLASEMGGRYVPLPVAGAAAISAIVHRELGPS